MDKRGSLDIGERVNKEVEENLRKKQHARGDLGKFIYLFGIVGIILAIIHIWKNSVLSASASFLIVWVAYLLVAVLWFVYGIYYKNRAIVVVYGLWIILELIILVKFIT